MGFICVPVFSSISLDLLPERAATLMVYEDIVEIVSGLQGKWCVCVSWLYSGHYFDKLTIVGIYYQRKIVRI